MPCQGSTKIDDRRRPGWPSCHCTCFDVDARQGPPIIDHPGLPPDLRCTPRCRRCWCTFPSISQQKDRRSRCLDVVFPTRKICIYTCMPYMYICHIYRRVYTGAIYIYAIASNIIGHHVIIAIYLFMVIYQYCHINIIAAMSYCHYCHHYHIEDQAKLAIKDAKRCTHLKRCCTCKSAKRCLQKMQDESRGSRTWQV